MKRIVFLIVLAVGMVALADRASAAHPLKIYILAGQSNMEGHAAVSTFDSLAGDPITAPILKEMRNADGTPRVCEKVWVSYCFGGSKTEPLQEKLGKLTTNFGANPPRNTEHPLIGPEFTFGIYMEKQLNEPILIIKTAWGGKSLNTDFRSPSGGPYEFNKTQLEAFAKQGKNLDEMKAEKAEATGHYYKLMVEHVKKVLADIKRVYPDYDPQQGYELAGFVWFQGFNDMVDSSTYPDRKSPGGYDLYSTLLAHFIRDVRKDLSAPKMPFVVGVMGIGGIQTEPNYFRQAMAAPANLPEFKGNVINVYTEKFWDPKLDELANRAEKLKGKNNALNKDQSLTAEQRTAALEKYKAELFTPEEWKMREQGISNQAYHYLGAAKIMAQIGKGFADGMLEVSNLKKANP